jgi:hypothetical protein
MSSLGCGGSRIAKGGESSQSSRDINPAQGPAARYNGFVSTSGNLKGTTAYFGDLPSQAPDQVKVRLDIAYSTLFASDKIALRFFKWGEGLPPSPTSVATFFFWDSATGLPLSYVNSSQQSVLYLETINDQIVQNVIATNSLATSGITKANFFQRIYLVFVGMDLRWDALNLARYDSAQGAAALESVDFLLPPFYANPATYEATRANTAEKAALVSIHPNRSRQSSGLSDTAYFNFTQDNCASFHVLDPAMCN